MPPKQDDLRNRVYRFYCNNGQSGKSYTVAHFMKEGVPQSTVYAILQRFHNNLPSSHKAGGGRPAKIFTPRKIRSLRQKFDHKDGISQRLAAKKFKCSPAMINKTLKKLKIDARKKKTIPDKNERQKPDAKTKCGRFYRKFSQHSWIIDDESYFTLANSTIHGNNTFYTSDISATPPNVKFSKKKKYKEKILVWIALGPNGLSQPFFKKTKGAMSNPTYLEECIKKRLIPYIRANYERNFVFWPDKASCHYANVVKNHLRQEGIDFVEYEDNPTNVPEARSIEDFWSILKGHVYANAWRASSKHLSAHQPNQILLEKNGL